MFPGGSVDWSLVLEIENLGKEAELYIYSLTGKLLSFPGYVLFWGEWIE